MGLHQDCEYNCGATDCEAPLRPNAKEQAQVEIDAEDLREAVDAEKVKIRTKKPFLHKIFPWKVTWR
jgi:hypothetical protein